MSDQLVNVTIDGRTVQVPKGTLVVEAAKQAGIDIPVFCYHPKLDPAGVCRMCLVQIEKIPKPQTACTTRVADGMVVHTQTERVEELRKGVLEFLLLNHPLDCPVCDKGGECDLQDNTLHYGATTSRMQIEKMKKNKSVDLGNFVVLDNERCVLCRRCVRFDEEIANEGNLIVEERGHRNFITTLQGERFDSYFSGNTIELCPVGALTSELYRFQARPWDLAKVDSVCHGCSVGCNVKEEYRFGQLLRLTGAENPAINNGWLCDRGRFNYKFIQAGDRVTQPLVKKDGQFVPATWSEALALVAEKLKAVKAAAGGKALGVIGGGKLANEEAYLLQKFARVALGTNNVDHRVSDQIVASLGSFPAKQADLSDAGAILVIDTNPAETAPVLDLRIRKMADRKRAKLALIGSVMPKYRGRHARVQVKPGQTPAVLAALAAVLAGKQPEASAADPEALTQLAALLQGVIKVAVVWGGNDAATGRAVVDLANALKKVASGGEPGRSVHVLIPGAQANSRGAEAMGVLPNFLPGYTQVAENKTVSQTWGVRNLPTEAGLATGAMLQAAADGQVQVLYLAGANLMGTFPNRKLAEAALSKAFVVAHELFLNETAQLADVVLPVAGIGEKAGTYTTLDGVVQATKVSKKAEGLAQPDGDILVAVASAMGVKLSGSPAETAAEIAKLVAKVTPGAELNGAPQTLLPANPAAASTPDGLILVPVDRLYAGGSTAQFDLEFKQVQPKAEALFNPADALKLGIKTGEAVELTAGGAALRLTARLEKSVVAGTIQAIKGLSAAPVNSLTDGTAPVVVTVAKLSVEVAD